MSYIIPQNTTINFYEMYTKNIPQPILISYKKICLNKNLHTIVNSFTDLESINFNCRTELIKMLNIFFGNINNLSKNDLVNNYKNLKDYVISNKLIPMVIYGINLEYYLINYYTDNQRNEIKLTIHGICRVLLKEYFTLKEFNECCDLLIFS